MLEIQLVMKQPPHVPRVHNSVSNGRVKQWHVIGSCALLRRAFWKLSLTLVAFETRNGVQLLKVN